MRAPADLAVWRALALAQWREQPVRVLITLLTIAFGVALTCSVYLVNGAALNEFDQATKRLVGEADVIVRGPRSGFSEQLYANLAVDASIRVASPVLELEVALPQQRGSLRVMGLDAFRAVALQPALVGELAGGFLRLFAPDGIYLSQSAARSLGVQSGGRFEVIVGAERRSLQVLGILSDESYPDRVGIMDIASAQWTLARIGVINRIDLQLMAGTPVETFRAKLAVRLPAGLQAVAPQMERGRAISITRAYRVNLNMLALVSLLTGALLLFATQSLSILRRRTSLALLRALGVTRAGLQSALIGEGVALGAAGSLLGIALGYGFATLLLHAFGGSFGAGQSEIARVVLPLQPLALLGFFTIGTTVAGFAAWIPAREAARRAPARGLKAGDAELAAASIRPARAGVVLLLLGAALALLPALGGVPVFGYCAIAALLFGALMLVPSCTQWLLARMPRIGHAPWHIGLAQLRGSVAQITVGLAAVIVSFSLMIAMAIMVYSFRQSFYQWLQQILPADIQLRAAQGSDTAFFDSPKQDALRLLAGVAAVEFSRSAQLLLDAKRVPVTLVARDFVPANRADILSLVSQARVPAGAPDRIWVSEAMQDLYGMQPGSIVMLPLADRMLPFYVAGVFRDYGRPGGAVVMARSLYAALTGDRAASEASLWLQSGADARAVTVDIRGLDAAGALEVRSSTELRDLSMRSFDRAFSVTYALEAAAVLIGLLGIACAGAATALARRSEFGMLRHLGMLRRQIVSMLAGEGLLVSALGALYGLVLGCALSLVLVYVVNRQSFNWSIDFAVPWGQLGAFCGALLLAAAITNVLSGCAALSTAALRAVREDW